MRFPFSLTWATGRYIARNKWERREKFPIVLMLEPLHRCNLRCGGCGRVREYRDSLDWEMSLDDCLRSIDECGAPIVSVCGGEPLLYEELPALLDETLKRNKHIYLCSNGTLLEKSLPKLERIRNRYLKKRLFLNVHLDGPAGIHDRIAGKPGTFDLAFQGIRRAKQAGFRVYTNTTVYRPTTIESLVELAEKLRSVSVDGLMISPAFGFQSVRDEATARKRSPVDSVSSFDGSANELKRSEFELPVVSPQTTDDDSIFQNRDEIVAFFREVRTRLKKERLTATPVFMDFLCGELSLSCAAWANPTRNPRGWRSPCYLIGDRHFATFDEFMTQTDWSRIGVGKDDRCRNCMTHCGFEPASVLQIKKAASFARLAFWQLFS